MKKSLRIICTAASLTIAVAGIACARDLVTHLPRGSSSDKQPQSLQVPNAYEYARSKRELLMQIPKIMTLNKDKNYALSRTQAKKVLAVLRPIRSKAKLSPAEAKMVTRKLERIMTRAQNYAYDQLLRKRWSVMKARMKGQEKAMVSHTGTNGPRPGAPGHGKMPTVHINVEYIKNFNPFYSGCIKGDPMRMGHSLDPFFDDLKKRAGEKR